MLKKTLNLRQINSKTAVTSISCYYAVNVDIESTYRFKR